MKRLILFSLVFLLFDFFALSAKHAIKIIDNETNEPISFVVVTTDKKNVQFEANIDGYVSYDFKPQFNYVFSRIGYKSIQLSGTELTHLDVVKMIMIAYEINPIIVTADAAWRDLNRAIDSTYKSIPKTPLYLQCYQNDKVEINNSTVVNARAIMVSEVSNLFKAGKGSISSSKLKGLDTKFCNGYTVTSIKRFSYYQVPFINDFLVGIRKYDKDISFYYIDINDSTVIIGYSPKLNFTPTKGYVITSGRFLINKKSWKILRIDSDLNQKMLDFQNERAIADPNKEILIQMFTRTIFLSNKGLPTKLQERFNYKLKTDKTESIWINTTLHSYKEIKEKEFETVPVKRVEAKSIIYQKPFSSLTFDFDKESQ